MSHLSKSQLRRKQSRKQLATDPAISTVDTSDVEVVAAPKKQAFLQRVKTCKAITFLRDVKSELKRVTWPTKKDVLRWSVVVIVALLLFTVLTLVLDQVITTVLVWVSSYNVGA